MKKYIYENRILEFDVDISTTNIVSNDINDNFDNDKRLPKYIELSELQSTFHDKNPTATVQEVWNMELTPPYIDPRTQAEKRQEQYGFRIPVELSQAFITYRAEAVAYRIEGNEVLALIADEKANEKAQEIAAIKEQIRIEYPD